MGKFSELTGKEKTLFFTKTVIEFFMNDFGIIHDFLLEESPWDNQLALILEVDKSEIISYKDILLSSIVNTYHNNVLVYPMKNGINRISTVDEEYAMEIEKGNNPLSIFINIDACSTNMIKFFIKSIEKEIDIKLDTFNFYKLDLNILNDYYWDLYEKYGLDEDRKEEIEHQQNLMSLDMFGDYDEEDEYIDYEEVIKKDEELLEKLNSFYRDFYAIFMNYIKTKFRNVNDERMFLNYLLTLTYADIKSYTKELDELLGIELAVLSIVDDDLDIVETISYNSKICEVIFDTIFQNIGTESFDVRKSVRNNEVQEKFKKLDSGYDYKYEYPINMIYNFSVDERLETMLSNIIENCTIEEIKDMLLGNMEIYSILYDNELDARFEEYYKMLTIRKIISDVLESTFYIKDSDPKYELIVNDIVSLAKDSKSIFAYFYEHFDDLFVIYDEYHKFDNAVIEKIRLYAIKNGITNQIISINPFASTRFYDLKNITDDIVECVDYINIVLSRGIPKEGIYDFIFGNDLDDEDRINVINTMCLNVYEHLRLEKKESDEKNMIIEILESNIDMVEYFKSNKDKLEIIYQLLTFYNKRKLGYQDYDYMKSKIEDKKYIKTIERLNPFIRKDKE